MPGKLEAGLDEARTFLTVLNTSTFCVGLFCLWLLKANLVHSAITSSYVQHSQGCVKHKLKSRLMF